MPHLKAELRVAGSGFAGPVVAESWYSGTRDVVVDIVVVVVAAAADIVVTDEAWGLNHVDKDPGVVVPDWHFEHTDSAVWRDMIGLY